MKEAFSLGNMDTGNRKARVKWVKELNDLRKITHHPEKGVLSVDQVGNVKELSVKVEKFFV